MALPKGTQAPAQVNPTLFFSLDEFSKTVFDALSDGYKKLIMASPEYQAVTNPVQQHINGPRVPFEDTMEDIPF